MPDATVITQKPATWARRIKNVVVPVLILLMAGGIMFLVAGNWNTWSSERLAQETDDAYLRADLTPLSTKVAGLVAKVNVSDYQQVKAGDLLVELRDEDFGAQVQQAEAAVAGGEDALINNRRQKELQDARIVQAEDGIRAAEADITAAEAGIDAANSTIANARSGIEATKADVQRTLLERRRQEALVAAESATRQKLEQVVADEERFRAQLASREADLTTASAQLASRRADLARAQARLGSTKSELEAQKRQRAVLDSQELLLRADLEAKRASLALARTNLGYTRIVAPEYGNHRSGERHRERAQSARRTIGQSGHPGDFARTERSLGAGELQRDAGSSHPLGRPRGNPCGCVSGRDVQREGRSRLARQRISVRAAPTR